MHRDERIIRQLLLGGHDGATGGVGKLVYFLFTIGCGCLNSFSYSVIDHVC